MGEGLSQLGKPRANTLDGATWTRYSTAIWSDIRGSAEQRALEHPALFPVAAVLRLIACLMRPKDRLVIDPFCGLTSPPPAARMAGKDGIGLELSPRFAGIAHARLSCAGKRDAQKPV